MAFLSEGAPGLFVKSQFFLCWLVVFLCAASTGSWSIGVLHQGPLFVGFGEACGVPHASFSAKGAMLFYIFTQLVLWLAVGSSNLASFDWDACILVRTLGPLYFWKCQSIPDLLVVREALQTLYLCIPHGSLV